MNPHIPPILLLLPVEPPIHIYISLCPLPAYQTSDSIQSNPTPYHPTTTAPLPYHLSTTNHIPPQTSPPPPITTNIQAPDVSRQHPRTKVPFPITPQSHVPSTQQKPQPGFPLVEEGTEGGGGVMGREKRPWYDIYPADSKVHVQW